MTSLGMNDGRVEFHTFHSFLSKMVGFPVHDGIKFIKAINCPFRRKHRYDALVIDECQDMTPDMFQVVCRIRNECLGDDARILLLGDIRQCIFDFNEANPFYLFHADLVWKNMTARPWMRCTLHESFRCPQKICRLVNSLMDMELMKPATPKQGTAELYVMNMYSEYDVYNRIANLMFKF